MTGGAGSGIARVGHGHERAAPGSRTRDCTAGGSGVAGWRVRADHRDPTFQVTGVFYVGPKQALVVEPGRIRVGGSEITGECYAEDVIGKAIVAF